MAIASLDLIHVLRKAAQNIQCSSTYQWGHMGSCNCGFLTQEVTRLSRAEIHRRAMLRHGDWNEQLNDYCPTSGQPMDDLISELISFGFDTDDLKHLEKLSDPEILAWVVPSSNLQFNVKEDVIKYLRCWSDYLEAKLLKEINLPSLKVIRIESQV